MHAKSSFFRSRDGRPQRRSSNQLVPKSPQNAHSSPAPRNNSSSPSGLEEDLQGGTRLNKFIAASGYCSRRKADELIFAGAVQVNGVVERSPGRRILPDDLILVEGQQLAALPASFSYIMLHKPRGYLTTRSDDRGRKTVMDLVSDVPAMLRPVGRLDKDSEGLLLMTDDGAFINMLTHPSGGVGKLYRVTVNPRATEQQIIEMSSGVVLDDGVKTKPCVIHVVVDEPGRSVLEITLHEGRNRQIRRMCSAVGLQVVRLRRSAEGPVKLGMLQPGEYRELKKSEINALRNAAMKSSNKGESRPSGTARRPGPIRKRTNSD